LHQELCPEAEEILLGDPHRIKQILINILGNSIKFTEVGYISLRMTVEHFGADQKWVRLRIRDTGIGMDPKFMENLFTKFMQEDSSIVRKFGGTGLGLSITKELIDLMGGNISVQSEKGKGTEMTIFLPFRMGKETDLPEVADAQSVAGTSVEGNRVLLVEDNELNQQVAGMTLKHFGLEVDVASNGKQAIEVLSQKQFDIVLMDVQMPIMDGYEAARMVRQELKLDVPIIALTANALKGEAEKCLNAGMNDFVSKPFDETTLLKILSKWLKSKSLLQAVETKQEEIEKELMDPIYDLSKLESISRGDNGFMKKVLGIFVDQTPTAVEEIKFTAASGDFATMGKIAHRIKPSLDNLGIKSMYQIIRDIEKYEENGNDIPGLKEQIQQLEATVNAVVEDIKKNIFI
jgi:CheY-like chemotaxis protein/HPt (histidine-containing phosphotransfer) domain-containing protein